MVVVQTGLDQNNTTSESNKNTTGPLAESAEVAGLILAYPDLAAKTVVITARDDGALLPGGILPNT